MAYSKPILGWTLRFRNHLSLLSHLIHMKATSAARERGTTGLIAVAGGVSDLCSAFSCLLGPGDNRVWRGILPVSGGLGQLGGRETPNNFCRTIVVGETSPLHSLIRVLSVIAC
jgi:hypothetical protein